MTRRKTFKVQARSTEWSNADGTTDIIVKLFGGSRGSIAVDYSQIPHLIAELATLLHQQPKESSDGERTRNDSDS